MSNALLKSSEYSKTYDLIIKRLVSLSNMHIKAAVVDPVGRECELISEEEGCRWIKDRWVYECSNNQFFHHP